MKIYLSLTGEEGEGRLGVKNDEGLSTGLAYRSNGDSLAYILSRKQLQTDKRMRDLASPKVSWSVDASQTAEWGIRTGDLVRFFCLEGRLIVSSVNGVDEPELTRARPNYADLVTTPGSRPRYPEREWQIDILGDPLARAWRLWAPVGRGSQLQVPGPFGSGKTWTVRSLVKGILAEGARDRSSDLIVVVLQVGERGADVAEMEQILSGYTDSLPIYHFVATIGETGPIATVNICDMAAALVKRQAETAEGLNRRLDLLYVVDSISGLAEAYNPHSPAGNPLTTGGVTEFAMARVKEHVALSGLGHCVSITGVFTALLDPKNTFSVSMFTRSGGPQSSSIWTLGNFDGVAHPKIDLANTRTREESKLLPAERLAFHQELRRRLAQFSDKADALAELQRIALLPGSWEEVVAAVRQEWTEAEARNARREVRDAGQQVINASLHLEKIRDFSQAAQLVLAMLKNAWKIGSNVEALLKLLSALPEDQLQALSRALVEQGLIKELPAPERLRQAALDLFGQSTAPDAFREAIEVAGINPSQFVANGSEDDEWDRAKLMKAISAILKAGTGRGFSPEVASKLAATDLSPLFVLQQLAAGKAPKDLYQR